MVFVDKAQIQQVLLNLMLNAVEVMPNGGNLFLDYQTLDGRAQIYVKDDGGGIPNDLQHRIFESFLTGKKDGTGLGLTISKRIMRAHDGDLELVDTGQNGTTFLVVIPLTA